MSRDALRPPTSEIPVDSSFPAPANASFPESIALSDARSDCVAVCGDGGVAMTMNALLTAAGRLKGATGLILLDIVTTEDAPFWQVQSPFAKVGAGGE